MPEIHNNQMNQENRFIFVGYSVRTRHGSLFNFHKPSCDIVSFDEGISPINPFMESLQPEQIGDYINYNNGLRYTLEPIIESLKEYGLDDEWGIFGFSIDADYLQGYKIQVMSKGDKDSRDVMEYGYALAHPKSCDGIFIGYDIIDIEVGNISGLTNCEINWKTAEKCGILNKRHLFSTYAEAKCFKKMADKLVIEHAPFAIWAIHEIPIDYIQK